MLSDQARIDQLAYAVEAVDVDTAAADRRQQLDANELRDAQPPPHIAGNRHIRRAVAARLRRSLRRIMRRVSRHEAAHAWCGYCAGWFIQRLALREDATGICLIAGSGNDYATALDSIVFQLVGLASDSRESAGTVPHCYDTVAARLKVDALNSRAIGPAVTFRHVAERAVAFVDENIVAIENIGLVLYQSRELIHADVELFGRCGQ